MTNDREYREPEPALRIEPYAPEPDIERERDEVLILNITPLDIERITNGGGEKPRSDN